MTWKALAKKAAALGLAVVLAGVLALTYAAYRGAFRPAVPITVESGRAGLALRSGALVKRHGVEVGRVVGVENGPGGAVVEVRLDRHAAAAVPSDTRADITSTTVFGEKYITLTDPPDPSTRSIAAGATIRAGSVTVEIDSVFESLTAILRAVDPAKLNVTLSAVAGALRGQGDDLGRAIDDANAVLAQIDPLLPQLRHDMRSTADTTEIYADAADDLSDTLTRASTTADTLVDTADTLDHVLLAVIGMSDTGTQVLSANADPLTSAITLLDPTTSLLGEYAPEITCFLQGADEARTLAEPVSGGNGASMLLRSTLLLGTSPYTYPDNLPVVRASGGPRCGSLPKTTMADVPTPYVVADTGANPFRDSTGGRRLVPGSLLDLLYTTSTPGRPR
ncbi:phospholipid/cholesterol/gamma-HCH transport system substrate-binding protein [Nocardia transvalensis]|uniref:Phospholipid/cholesterol/gamma-HCH transport system substrate-binding protein n=1 Tax=Nocardia transvalensis TaxID=37333 RepID=A0A7W9PKG1_9NOCA|nr:MCE family protein [Nocardia transvalensis]MBB5917814.1 phospholipid/cholesterol/gamma-HCH transport system substrate-binding protein [Nocardia transvalensis]